MEAYDIILSGSISKDPNYKLNFAKAYAAVRHEFYIKNGHVANVWNPAEMPEGRSYNWYMEKCVRAIFASPKGILMMLPGWRNSNGAIAERALAISLRMEVVEL